MVQQIEQRSKSHRRKHGPPNSTAAEEEWGVAFLLSNSRESCKLGRFRILKMYNVQLMWRQSNKRL
jgi:hypothetical protein